MEDKEKTANKQKKGKRRSTPHGNPQASWVSKKKTWEKKGAGNQKQEKTSTVMFYNGLLSNNMCDKRGFQLLEPVQGNKNR